MRFDRFRKLALVSVLFVGVLQMAAYRLGGVSVSSDGAMPPPQPDTLLYCQAARRIVEGHPFSFSAGEPVSTGTTSVLYPFLLAVPYAAGARGTHLLTAGFWLNALCYLAFLAGWTLAFLTWFRRRPAVAVLASALLAISPQAAFCAFAQSDAGLMMATAAGLAAGLATGRVGLWATVLVLAPWVRPEGMMCVVAFVPALIVRQVCWRRKGIGRPVARAEALAVAVALVSVLGVFALNLALTGEAQFSSVANKGYFRQNGFLMACQRTAQDAYDLVRTYFCGLGADSVRRFFVCPLVGGLAFLAGLFALSPERLGDRLRRVLPLALAAALSFVTVSVSGWAGTNFDRYLAWCQPLPIAVSALGAFAIGCRFARRRRLLLPVTLLVFQVLTAVVTQLTYVHCCRSTDRYLRFSRLIGETLPEGASVGSVACNLAYLAGDRRFYNFSGIYSPDFSVPGRIDEAALVSILRREPSLRPDYLVLEDPSRAFGMTERKQVRQLGEEILSGPVGLSLVRADWTLFDAAASAPEVPGKALRFRLDVGYHRDEASARFEVFDRWNRTGSLPFVRYGRLNGRPILDSARTVVGGTFLTAGLEPGKEATVVLRVLREGPQRHPDYPSDGAARLEHCGDVVFNLEVDGKPLGTVTCRPLESERAKSVPGQEAASDDAFRHVVLTLPGSALVTTPVRLAFLGDHIPAAYWIYQ